MTEKRILKYILTLGCCAAAACFLLSGCAAKPAVSLPEPEYATPALTPTPAPTPEPTPEPTPADEYFVISMVGDCTLSSTQYENVFETLLDGDMTKPFSKTRQYFIDDYLTIANLECSLSHTPLYGSGTFQFCGDAGNAEILTEGGVDFVTLGNNHTMDFGQTGLDNTRAVLDEYGIAHAGPGGSFVFSRDGGITVGLYAAAWNVGEAQIRSGVSALAARGDCDIIICLMHWGNEGSYRATGTQTALAHAAVDSGADIVYGSHPHVLQKTEEYGGGYILYSLGNYVFGGNTNPTDKDTAIARVTVRRDTAGVCYVEGLELIPCSVSGVSAYNDFCPTPYESGTAEYERAMSKLDGSFTGPDLNVDYSEYHDKEAQS